MTTTIAVNSSLWKGLLVIAALIVAAGIGIWAYQTSKQITLTWDAIANTNDIQSIRIYDLAIVPPALVAEAPCSLATPPVCPTEVTFTMPKAAHTYVARTANSEWESPDSNQFTVMGPPPALTGLKKK